MCSVKRPPRSFDYEFWRDGPTQTRLTYRRQVTENGLGQCPPGDYEYYDGSKQFGSSLI